MACLAGVAGATPTAWAGAAGSTGVQRSPASLAAAAIASPGCQDSVSQPPSTVESTLSFTSGGISGTYLEDAPPPPAAQSHPAPLVVDLHGYLESAAIQEAGNDLGPYGRAHGFVTITPQITESGVPRWNYGPHSADIAYLGRLITHVEGSLCIDERRVFVTGLSMGSFTTSAIACELSGRIAAVAPVAGLQAYPWCRPTRPVPVVAFQGTADPYVAYEGGPGPHALQLPAPDGSGLTIGQEIKRDPAAAAASGALPIRRSIPSQVATWAKRNGCASAHPTRSHIAADVTLVRYACPAQGAVDFYIIKGGGHTWPGGPPGVYPLSLVGRTTTSISANQIMWQFFQAHPLPGRPVDSAT